MRPRNLQILFELAQQAHPHEACGLVLNIDGKEVIHPVNNVASNPHENFEISPDDYAAAEDLGEVIGLWHSHPNASAEPSEADRASCEASGLPWHIVSYPEGGYTITDPCGHQSPLLGRRFVHGVHDCYGLVRDYYQQTLNITLPDFPREDQWWHNGQNLYLEHFAEAGFVKAEGELSKHDVILMTLDGAAVPNHGAVYLGNSLILQHLQGKLSATDLYAEYYRKATYLIVRHASLC